MFIGSCTVKKYFAHEILLYFFSGDEAAKKWTNIRDAFALWRRKKALQKSGSAAKNIKPYKYHEVLEFLIPHLKCKP